MKVIYLIGSLIAAGTLWSASLEGTRFVHNSHGGRTLFVPAKPETFTPAERAASERARQQSGSAPHAGEVYYKKGVNAPAFRYVTSGRIVVRFSKTEAPDPEAFARANGLVYRRSVGIGGKSAVFLNQSDEDDIAKANSLLGQANVLSAEPDWVLPVKLY
jgi:hypothetical protein